MSGDSNPYDVAGDDYSLGREGPEETVDSGHVNVGFTAAEDGGGGEPDSSGRTNQQIGNHSPLQHIGNAVAPPRAKISRSPDDALPTPGGSLGGDIQPPEAPPSGSTWNVDLVERHFDDSRSGDSPCLKSALKALKVFAAFAFFIILVLGSVLSRSSLMLLGAQLGYNDDMVCQVDTGGLALACYRVPRDLSNSSWRPELPPPPTTPPPTLAPNFTEPATTEEGDRQALRHAPNALSLPEQKDNEVTDNLNTDYDGVHEYVTLSEFNLIDSRIEDNVTTVNTSSVTEDTTSPTLEAETTTPLQPTDPGPDWHVVRVQRCDALAIRYAWALLICITTPYVMEFCLCAWRTCFSRSNRPRMKMILLACLVETLHSAGETIFVFRLLRVMHVLEVMAMVFCVAVLPSLLKLCFRPLGDITRKYLKMGADVAALLIQVTCVVAMPVILSLDGSSVLSESGHMADLWLIPISLLLVSVYWWENFVDDVAAAGPCFAFLIDLRKSVASRRDKIYAVTCLWKVLITFVFMISLLTALDGFSIQQIFSFPSQSACAATDDQGDDVAVTLTGLDADWVGITCVQIFSSLLVHQAGVKACQTLMQLTCFSLPLLLAPFVTIGFFMGMCESWNEDFTSHESIMPLRLFWNCYPVGNLVDVIFSLLGLFFLITAVSYVILTRYIWFPTAIKLARSKDLFTRPLYSATFIEPSIALNRRRDDRKQSQKERRHHRSRRTEKLDDTPYIIACTTMWKETEQEMLRVLKSIMRLDQDQFTQNNANVAFSANVDAYEFEAHIFFDNAIIHKDDFGGEIEPPILNNFVMQLIRIMDQAVSAVYKCDFWLDPPVKTVTPYGGRLEWTMKGGNKLTAHLKDNTLVRHKKRWSQVMYMYYFLGHKLWAEPLEAEEKKHWAENTYILALDGDIEFRPEALKPLIHALRKNPKVGAACSRIHPTGSGPMIWYQKFEYAIGHWFQKSTEHMIGCVLCSPGCFSLMRGWALLHGNVMKKYAQESTSARHFIQYDLGEDRWLCTLILRQGFRIEYLASADAYTHAPEGYIEFMKQRRRWGPSTLGNITDILLNSSEFVAKNQSMSTPYIGYQASLLGTTLLGPATIFMMIVGALQTAFGQFGITLWTSLLINIIPCTAFIVICYVASSDTQIKVAGLLSALYSVIMALVLIGISMSIAEDGWCSPTTIFLLMIVVFFLVAAILHPQEFTCIIPGLLYFILIPCMYFFLVIYSMCNLHLVSWGTRDDNKTLPSGLEAQQLKDRSLGSKSEKFLGLMDVQANKEDGWTVQMGHICKCLCCLTSKPNKEYKRLKLIAEKLVELEAGQQQALTGGGAAGGHVPTRRRSSVTNRTSTPRTSTVQLPGGRRRSSHAGAFAEMVAQELELVAEEEEYDGTTLELIEAQADEEKEEEEGEEDGQPRWMKVKELRDSEQENLPEEEEDFWTEFIAEYLRPIVQNEEEQKEITKALLELRNNITLFFFLINGIFIAVVFTLQLQTDVNSLIIRLPCGSGGDSADVEPIGFIFLIIFGIIMVIQFFGMIFHRLGTLWYVLTDTFLGCGNLGVLQDKKAQVQREKLLLTYELQRPGEQARRGSSVATSGVGGESDYATIDSIQDIQMARERKASKANPSLQTVFDKRYKQLTEEHKARLILMKMELDQAQETGDLTSGGEESDNEESDMATRDRRKGMTGSQRRPKLRRAPLPPIPKGQENVIEMTSFRGDEPTTTTTVKRQRQSVPDMSVSAMRSRIRRESRTAAFGQQPQRHTSLVEGITADDSQRPRSRTSLGQNSQPKTSFLRQGSIRRAPTKDGKEIDRLDKKLDQLGQLRKQAKKLKLIDVGDMDDSIV